MNGSKPTPVQNGGYRVSCRCRVATICNESQCGASELGVQSGDPGPVSCHGEPRHVIVNIACGDQDDPGEVQPV